MVMDTVSFLQFATLSMILLGVKIVIPLVYKTVRAQRRLSERIAAISEAQISDVHCDERSVQKLRDQLDVLLVNGSGLSRFEEVYILNKTGDASLETIRLFGAAFSELSEDDRRIVERALKYATGHARTSYLQDAFSRAQSCRRKALASAKDGFPLS
jgi:hypothetical protein